MMWLIGVLVLACTLILLYKVYHKERIFVLPMVSNAYIAPCPGCGRDIVFAPNQQPSCQFCSTQECHIA